MFDSQSGRGGMRVFSPKGASVILLVGALVVVGSLQLGRPTGHVVSDPMSFWEAAGRRPMTATAGNETDAREGPTGTSPGGIRLPKAAPVPARVSAEAGLIGPHPRPNTPPGP